MEHAPFVSVVIVTADRAHIIGECLSNVSAQTYAPFEVLIVDGSRDNRTGEIAGRYPAVRYFKSAISNTPVQRNAGVEHSRGEIIAFIDDDSMVDKDWLANLVPLYADANVGGAGGAVIEDETFTDKDGRIGRISDKGKFIANFHLDGNSEGPIEVDHLKGCNMSFRKTALLEAGKFDPEYKGTCFCEETDMCLRIGNKGHKIVFSPRARVRHLASHRPGYSRDRYNMKFQYYYSRNKTYFFVRNFGLGRRTMYFALLDTLDHAFSYMRRAIVGVAHSYCLFFLNVYGKMVGGLLALTKRG
jgi:Predicted glycosyltransferases